MPSRKQKIAPLFWNPQRQQLSVFSKYLSGTKPGLLVLNDETRCKKITDELKKRRLVSDFAGGVLCPQRLLKTRE
jgi:hypothetical protein